MLKINNIKKSRLFIAGALVVCGVVGGLWSYHTLKEVNPAKATLAGFEAGNLMSDTIMSNYNSMTEQQIWDFLHQHGNCNDRNTYKASQYPSLKYHIKDGHFVCMADETFDGETTSHIIWQAAQDYHINPQVLIVVLQKEQNLVLDSWPNDHQYRSATGFGCPDTAACDSQYFGFRNQVRQAANMFRDVLNGGWSNYPAYKTSFIHYHPNSGCGGQNIYIANRATSALYRYTPYVPNQAALNAGKGTGDSCSSYGNRNFYNYFTDWFGDSRQLAVSNVDIPNGVYNLVGGLNNSNELLDVTGDAVNRDNSNIELWQRSGAKGQNWQITRLDNGLYTLSVAGTDMYLDVVGGGTSNGTNVQLWHRNTGVCNQQWAIMSNGDGYRLRSACSGRSLDIVAGNVHNGTNVQIYDNFDTINQRWYLQSVIKDGVYNLIGGNYDGNKLLDVSDNAFNSNGSNINLWQRSGANGQNWQITRLNDSGLYTLRVPGTDMYLDVASGGTSNGTNVQLWHGNTGACSQQWNIISNGDGYRLMSACSGKSLDIVAGNLNDGTNVQVYDSLNNINQRWYLQAVVENGTYNLEMGIGRFLDVAGNAINRQETNVQIWSGVGTMGQKWHVARLSNGMYMLNTPGTNYYLDVAGANKTNGTNVRMWSGNSSCAQQWNILADGGGYTLTSGCTRKNLDVQGNSFLLDGANVWLWSKTGTDGQRWKINFEWR